MITFPINHKSQSKIIVLWDFFATGKLLLSSKQTSTLLGAKFTQDHVRDGIKEIGPSLTSDSINTSV